MNFVSRTGARVVIRQVPMLLLFVTAVFSLPPLAFSLFHLLSGTDADGKYFSLFFGLFILWLFLEFVATRERIEIDLTKQVLKRSVSGVFRHSEQVVDLSGIEAIELESRVDEVGLRRLRRQYLYVSGRAGKYLLNSPAKVYLNHAKLGRALHEATRIPFQEQTHND
jgi:hypothetical protein